MRSASLSRSSSRSFSAFRVSREQPYLDYAALRLGSPQAGRTVVRAVFEELEKEWHRALRGASPAATAWELLSNRTSSAADAEGRLHELLPAAQADAVLLLRLGLNPEGVASLMGVPVTQLRASISAARRALLNSGHHLDVHAG